MLRGIYRYACRKDGGDCSTCILPVSPPDAGCGSLGECGEVRLPRRTGSAADFKFVCSNRLQPVQQVGAPPKSRRGVFVANRARTVCVTSAPLPISILSGRRGQDCSYTLAPPALLS